MLDSQKAGEVAAVKDSLRSQVCTTCARRVVDESAATTLLCEPACDLFQYLPRLIDVVDRFGHEPPCGYEAALRNLPCHRCSTPGCDDESCHETRPLDAFASDAMAIVELVVDRKKHR